MTTYKVYRRHNCSGRHESWNAAARCVWAGAPSITGEGAYAVLAKCDRGMSRGLTWTVTLFPTAEAAEEQAEEIYDNGCGDGCYGDHEIVQMDDAVLDC